MFCGHYHVMKKVNLENLECYITPSTYFQLDMNVDGFAIDHYNPGFRIIDLDEEKMSTTVHYLSTDKS